MIRHRSIRLALIAALLSLTAATVAHAGQITSTRITDKFAGKDIDQSIWWNGTNDPANVSIAQRGGRVTVQVGAGAGDNFNASLGTQCRLHGDFRAKLSYTLVDWPGNDSIDVSLMASDLGGVNVYASDDFGAGYGAYFPPNGTFVQTALEPRGALELVRQGSTFTGYYRDRANHRWVQVFSGPGSTEDTGITLAVFNIPNAAPFGHRPATIAFTSMRAKADAVVCS